MTGPSRAMVPAPVQPSKHWPSHWVGTAYASSGWSGSWAVIYRLIQSVLKIFHMLSRVRFMHAHLWWEQDFSKDSAGRIPVLLLHDPPDTWKGIPRAPLLILQPESWFVIYPLLPALLPQVQLPLSLLGFSNCWSWQVSLPGLLLFSDLWGMCDHLNLPTHWKCQLMQETFCSLLPQDKAQAPPIPSQTTFQLLAHTAWVPVSLRPSAAISGLPSSAYKLSISYTYLAWREILIYKIYIPATNQRQTNQRQKFFKKNFLHTRDIPENNTKSVICLLLHVPFGQRCQKCHGRCWKVIPSWQSRLAF